MPRKEINTALATNKNSPALSKNVSGPPVYYPPGKELFAKSEAQAALRARVSVLSGNNLVKNIDFRFCFVDTH